MQRITLAGALALLIVTGCATSGTRFDPDSVGRIEPGRTTQAQVKLMFGSPTTVRTRGTGGSEWSYDYREQINRDTGMISRMAVFVARLFGRRAIYSPVNVAYRNDIRHKLRVIFRSDGVVDDYVYERTDQPSKRVY